MNRTSVLAAAMNVRIAVERDVPEMHRLRMRVHENILRDASQVQPDHYLRMLNEHGRGWVCELEDRIVGFAVADLSRTNIWALFVDPNYEGRGIGRRLHETALDWLFDTGVPTVWLSTEPNTRAERFYTQAKWQYAGRQPNCEARYEMRRERWLTTR